MLDLSGSGLERPASAETFRPATRRARFLIVSLAAAVLLDAWQLLLSFRRLHLLDEVARGRLVPIEVLQRHDAVSAFAAAVAFVALLAGAVAFPLWLYRANQNLPALGFPSPDYSPGQAAASFFIPFVNLARPHSVAREIWKGSFGGEASPAKRRGPWLIGLWWGTWVGAGLLSWPAMSVSLRAKTPAVLTTLTRYNAASEALTIVSGLAAIAMVAAVQRGQSEMRWRIVHRTGLAALGSAVAPPSPPAPNP